MESDYYRQVIANYELRLKDSRPKDTRQNDFARPDDSVGRVGLVAGQVRIEARPGAPSAC